MKIVPSSQWTMEKRDTKRVEITGKEDKRQITAVFACTMSGKFLPMQPIYKGTTKKCFVLIFHLAWMSLSLPITGLMKA